MDRVGGARTGSQGMGNSSHGSENRKAGAGSEENRKINKNKI